ncbi:MAG TPA: transglycosylase domain-containing protein [Actinomycetota bacterium]|nr:transglycosylase domain-containing protein [Actinomycetota bacterium]
MANLPVSPFPRWEVARRALYDLLSRTSARLDAVPQLRMPAVRWALGALSVILLAGLVTAGFALYLMFAPVRLPEPIAGSRAATTQILGADGALIEEWHGPINRTFVPLHRISESLQEAAIAAEDARFYRRGAVDLRAVIRAAWANFENGSMVQGGSTISQQYAKNVYVGNAPTMSRKIREARVAYRLERELGKKKVLEGYLNTVYFGRGAYGVEAASKVYFGKAAEDVTVPEAALLISMVRSPDGYSPYEHPVRSEGRRRWVLERMEGLGYLTPGELRDAVAAKPALTPASSAHPRYGWYLDALRTYLIRRYGSEKVYAGGLKVQTTLDPQAQEAAELTIAGTLPDPDDPYAALASVDPQTGYVKALVGGREYTDEKFNIAIQGRRQPGSAFKPFVLVAALEEGISPSAVYRAPARMCPKVWRPSCVSNYGGSGYGSINLERATINSVNTVYAQLVLQVGPKKVVDVARRMGIPGPEWMPPRSACRPTAGDPCRTLLQPVPAMALGAEEVTPLELASAYATLAAGGIYREPKLVSRVEDASGRVLEQGPSEPRRAISPQIAETVNGILTKVISQGTGTRADFGRPAAGKTGTAQDFSNAWFSGYTPQLATAVWMGHRSGNQPLRNVQGVRSVAGGTLPAEIWREYMKGVSDRNAPTIELGEFLTEGAFSAERDLSFEGRAADSDGFVHGVEVSIDGAPFTSAGIHCKGCPGVDVRWSYRSPVSLSDGEHQIQIRSFDKPGHRSEPQSRKFTVDTMPPALRQLKATGGGTRLALSFSEPVACDSVTPAGFTVAVGGDRARIGSVACTGATAANLELMLTRPVLGGEAIVAAHARTSRAAVDRAGNPAAGEPIRGVATNKPPAVLLDREADPGPFTAEEVRFSGTAADPDGTLQALTVSVDGGGYSAEGLRCRDCGRNGSGAWEYRPPQPLAHGKHKLAFRVQDNAGTLSKPAVRTVDVDAVPPRLQRLAAAGGNSRLELGFTEPVSCAGVGPASFEATGGGRGLGVDWVTCPGPSSKTLELGLSSAVRGGDDLTVGMRGRRGLPADVAGNPAETRSVAAVATNRPPQIELGPRGADSAVSAARVEATGSTSDPDGTVQAVEVSVDGGVFSTAGVECDGCGRNGSGSWIFRPRAALGHGEHNLAFRSVDNAGVRSRGKSLAVTVDALAPAVRHVKASGGNAVVEVIFSEPVVCAPEPTAQMRVAVAGRRSAVTAVGCTGSAARLTLGRAPQGGEQVDVALRSTRRAAAALADPAGNGAADGSGSVVASNQPPVVEVTVPPVQIAAARPDAKSRTVDGTAKDPDGVVKEVEYSLDGSLFTSRGVRCRGCGRSGEVTFSINVGQAAGPVTVRARDSADALSGSRPQAPDTEMPKIRSLSVRPGASTVTALFSERMNCSTVDNSDFSVRVDGKRRPVLVSGCAGEPGDRVNLRVSGRVRGGQSVTVAVNGTLQDEAGNLVNPGSSRKLKVGGAINSKG